MRLEKLSRDDWMVGGVGLLTAISLLFFPWFSFSASFGHNTYTASVTGTGSPDGWLGVLALLCAIAVTIDLAIERLSAQTQIPAISGSRTTTRFVLGVAAAALIALKFLLHVHFNYFAWGFYASVVFVAALVYLTMRARASAATAPTVAAG